MQDTQVLGTSSDDTSLKMGRVPPELLNKFWPEVERLLLETRDLWARKCDAIDIYNWVLQESMHLWISATKDELLGAALLIVEDFPKLRQVRVFWASGFDTKEYLEQGIMMMEYWADSIGAEEVEVEGRIGWERRLKKLGYLKKGVVLQKDVTPHTEH